MPTSPTLLVAYPDDSGPFKNWLESLGLKEFLRIYPISKLVQWEWLVPQYRVVFPEDIFVHLYERCGDPIFADSDLNNYVSLWDYSWRNDAMGTRNWFLDDAFRDEKSFGEFFQKFRYESGNNQDLPAPVKTKSGPIRPYVDYFYPWQGYALVDLVRTSDCIMPIFNAPDILDRAKAILRIADRCTSDGSDWPRGLLTHPKQWGGREKLMTALDHFKSFKKALATMDDVDSPKFARLYRDGARQLGEHFGFTANSLADEVKENLLTLAHVWMSANSQSDSRAQWTQRAWPELRKDIQSAVLWLVAFGEKSFLDYVDEWQNPYFQNVGWAPLDEVLPYEFLAHQTKFAQLAPFYLKPFNQVCGEQGGGISEERILKQCRHLQRTNSAFAGFASSFFELHEELSFKSSVEVGIDFRSLRPLDHYAMVAIRVETCLREELRQLGVIDGISPQQQTLVWFIEALATKRVENPKIVGTFMSVRRLADLKHDRTDPIGRIQALKTGLPASDHMVVQAFLACTLARNYFAHHDFLDQELLRSSKSQFLMRGIVLTVLTLLAAK